jgi:SPP1 gp7 family putative phage head morphogenesis protein
MSRDYWVKREKLKLKDGLKDIKSLEDELKRVFAKASKDIEKEIFALFIKYAKDNDLTYKEASRLLTSSEFKEWRYDLAEYMKLIEETDDEKLLLELNTLAMKSRISRLEEMFYEVNKTIDDTFKTVENRVYNLLEGTISKNYYTTMYDLHKYVGVGASFAKVDTELVKSILSFPWSGMNYSQRIWKNRDKLKEVIKEEITQMVIQGKGSREVAKALSKRMDVSLENAKRLINTEHSYVMGEATYRAYDEFGVEKYQFLATLDNRTSKICQSLDLKIFNLNERCVGVNASPMHPRCRSTEIPYTKEDGGGRFARDSKGKGITVPANMKYDEWYDTFVRGNQKAEVAELKVRNKASDKKQFEKYKNVVGKEVPRSFDKFQEMKYTDSKTWEEVKTLYKDTNRYNKILENSSKLNIKGNPIKNIKRIDISDYSFEKNHINNERKHGVTKSMAQEFINNSKVVYSRWNDQVIVYVSESGCSVVNIKDKKVSTAYKSDEYDEKFKNLMEVLKND